MRTYIVTFVLSKPDTKNHSVFSPVAQRARMLSAKRERNTAKLRAANLKLRPSRACY